MTDHTPEPWQAIGGRKDRAIIGSKRSIARVWGAIQPDDRPDHPEADANAERIVACVNACAGIPTEQIEAGDFLELIDAVAHYMDPKSDHEAAWSDMKAALAPFQED